MFSLKGKPARTGQNRPHNSVYALADLLRTSKSLQVLTIFPRICRACRPTPCRHSACKRYARGVRLPLKAERRLSASRRASATARRPWSALPGLWPWRARLAARGRPALPPTTHPLGRVPCGAGGALVRGLPTNAGGGLEHEPYTRSHALCAGSIQSCARRYPQGASWRGAVY